MFNHYTTLLLKFRRFYFICPDDKGWYSSLEIGRRTKISSP